MGSSRRRRSSAEGTFLESVKDLMQVIVKELAFLREKIEATNGSSGLAHSVDNEEHPYWVPFAFYQDQCNWDVSVQADDLMETGEQWQSAKAVLDYLQPDCSANENIFLGHQVSRDTLLAYRNVQRTHTKSQDSSCLNAVYVEQLPVQPQRDQLHRQKQLLQLFSDVIESI